MLATRGESNLLRLDAVGLGKPDETCRHSLAWYNLQTCRRTGRNSTRVYPGAAFTIGQRFSAWLGVRHCYISPVTPHASSRLSCVATGMLDKDSGQTGRSTSYEALDCDALPRWQADSPWPCHAHALCSHLRELAASLPAISENLQPHFKTFPFPTP